MTPRRPVERSTGRVEPTTGSIVRAGPNDLLQLSFGSHPADSQVGAVLVLGTDGPPAASAVAAGIAERVGAVPRLRQRLRRVPVGCGRPVWVDDPRFDVRRHLTAVACPERGDERALLDLAAETVAAPLPADRPLWSATFVRGLAGDRSALILTFHHVLADGIGGLAMLGRLVDGVSRPPPGAFPRPPPTRRQLAADAARSRIRALRLLPARLRRLGAGAAQLRPILTGRAPRSSLNRPTGARRWLGVARADLTAIRSAAHAHGGTVNDVVLTAVAGAVRALLLRRGERLDRLVVSVPVSGRPVEQQDPLGNQTGVVPVCVPAAGDATARLAATVRATRAAKSGPRGASAALLEPVFRSLAALGVVRWYVNRQRRVNTFVTNLRGPPERLAFLGAPVRDLVVMNAVTGNVPVAFGALSYSGTLAVTIVADPDACPDAPVLVAELEHELDRLAELASPARRAATGRGPRPRSARPGP